ncbi:hypothetical protein U0868_22925 [Kluyvera ascorbata]|uniref:hypothetical protein n=1 Tax=Kluyvera ascorbata TaxID=51288 RepID=UPI002ABBFC59|nr:hypothetical protein [Kluyvera ascorbata]MDZ4034404.1 hypothetical protein [Kluyvera ascorbata]
MNVTDLIEMTGFGRLVPKPMYGFLPSWSVTQKSRIIEMLILGLPTETIWGEQDALGRTQILSGFDIFSAILDFSNSRFNLRNLRVLKHLDRLYYHDLAFAEKKHFEQMEMRIGVILHDSDPMLKCLFIENINHNLYGKNAAQFARNINFKRASSFIEKYSNDFMNYFTNLTNHSQLKYTNLQLKLQSDILYCLLICYIAQNKIYDRRISAFGLESYSHSRSHISNYNDYENVEITPMDDFDIALNKIMFMLDVEHRKLRDITYKFSDLLYSVMRSEYIRPDSIGSAADFLSGKEIKAPGLFNYMLLHCFNKPITLKSFSARMTNIDDFIGWVIND